MEKCEHNQTTAALRNRSGIKAYKILDIADGRLSFQLWLNDEESRGSVKTSTPCNVGQYVDLIVTRTSKTSHQIKFVGHTPQEFVPADGRNIAI